jgi:hypothetical protein
MAGQQRDLPRLHAHLGPSSPPLRRFAQVKVDLTARQIIEQQKILGIITHRPQRRAHFILVAGGDPKLA